MNNSNSAFRTNGSSVHSSRSTTPEPVADLPPAQLFEQSDERVPTPFPLAQQPIDEPIGNPLQLPSSLSASWVYPAPPLPLVMPIPSSRSRSPIQHAVVNMQLSNSGSSSNSIPPVALTPTVIIIDYPHALSNSESQTSFEAYGHLIRRLHEDRRMNEENRSRSVASGLYQYANMLMPSLPDYETSSCDDLGVEAEQQRQYRRETKRFLSCMCFAGALFGAGIFGQQMGVVFFQSHLK